MGQKKINKPVYTEIYRKLRDKIFRGILKPSEMLPSESQLCAEYQVSRETVRKGLQMLNQEGLIYSRAKVGYFVNPPHYHDFMLRLPEALEQCSTQYCDIHGILPDEALQKRLIIPANQKVIELSQIVKDSQGVTVAFEIKYIPYERAYPSVEGEIRFAVLPDITFSKLTSYEFYTDITVNAAIADGELASILECREGEPLLKVERTYIRQDGTPIGYSEFYSRGEYNQLHGFSGYVQNKTEGK